MLTLPRSNMARRTKEDAEKTRESLLDAAEAVFLRRGVSRATLEEIAREAGLTRGAVYWHFENKAAIFSAMHDRVKLPMDVMFDALTGGPDPLAGLKEMVLHVFHLVEKDAHVRNVLTILRLRSGDAHYAENDTADTLRRKSKDVHDKFTRVFQQIERHHPLSTGLTPEFAAMAFHSFISGVLWDYLTAPESYPLRRMAAPLVDMFFRGVLKS